MQAWAYVLVGLGWCLVGAWCQAWVRLRLANVEGRLRGLRAGYVAGLGLGIGRLEKVLGGFWGQGRVLEWLGSECCFDGFGGQVWGWMSQ